MDGAGTKVKSKRPTSGIELALPTTPIELKVRFGSSVIDQFALGHTPADVFRELVQNEYDAHGSEITIRFGSDTLSVSGTGRPINSKGWKRLGLIMGTGVAHGDGKREEIEAKQSGIGSKNFGVRSLFVFGNRINVRSDGNYAVLDMDEFGAAVAPDPASKGRKGVLIQVPYRTKAIRAFKAFTIEREDEAMDQIEKVLLPTLVKLANPLKGPGINGLTIISERTGRELRWRQTAKQLTSGLRGVTLAQRSGRLVSIGADGNRTTRTNEQLEFSTLIDIPYEHSEIDFPAYYRSGRKIRISVSLQMKGKLPDLTHRGRLYYPLEAGGAPTGMAVSANAPFQLDADRSKLIPNSTWNDWLLECCAHLTARLAGFDWIDRFGGASFHALVSNGQGGDNSLRDWTHKALAEGAFWPSEQPGKPSRAADLHIPDDPAFQQFIANEATLHRSLTSIPAAKELAKVSGALTFNINSLVRLRCGKEVPIGIATRLAAGESKLYYPNGVADLFVQNITASALSSHAKLLSSANKQDLRDTATTLSADGTTLKPAKDLILVPVQMHDACPVPPSERLHPELNPFTAVSGFCRIFKVSEWMMQAADRARIGKISEEEHNALYRYVMDPDTRFTSEMIAVLRIAPVLKDDLDGWTAPMNLAILPARDAAVLGIVRRAPERAAIKRPDLLKRLAIRRKVVAEDLLLGASKVEGNPDMAADFEDLLRRHLELLGRKELDALADVAFLRTRGGGLRSPSALHLPSPLNDECLDDPDLLVVDGNLALFRKLGCHETPNSDVLVEVIRGARDTFRSPPRPDLLYPALVQALKNEKMRTDFFSDEAILYVEGGFVAPEDCLVTLKPPPSLKGAVPIYRGASGLGSAFVALGASTIPLDKHWISFFFYVGGSAAALAARPLNRETREAVRAAYRIVGKLPQFDFSTLGKVTRFLLADDGILHSIGELEAEEFLENDYHELAEALKAAGAGISFADRDQDSRYLFRRIGIKSLSQVCGKPKIEVTGKREATAIQRTQIARFLEQLHRDDMAAAIAELSFARHSPTFHATRSTELRGRLKRIKSIQFVEQIERRYILKKRVSVAADATTDDNRIVLRPPRYKSEFDLLVASEVAMLAGATDISDIRALAPTISQLLSIRSNAEMESFLRLQGIEPKLFKRNRDEDQLNFGDDDGSDEGDAADILGHLASNIIVDPPSPTEPLAPVPPRPAPPPPVPAPPPTPLPPIASVTLLVTAPSNSPSVRPTVRSGGGIRAFIWTPPTLADIQRDREVGRRAEELVYRQEIERVRAFGYKDPEKRVIWVSESNPGADHDISSIDAEGLPIWLEVKGTMGTDGRFDWSIGEFKKALREGDRYHLWRVYKVGTENPVAKVFENPARLWKQDRLDVEIGSIRAAVEGI